MPADGGGTTVSFLLGNGDGTFQPHADFTVGFASNQVAVVDFNGDGRLDLAAADQSSNTVSILIAGWNCCAKSFACQEIHEKQEHKPPAKGFGQIGYMEQSPTSILDPSEELRKLSASVSRDESDSSGRE